MLLFVAVFIRILGLLDMPLGSDQARHIVRAHAIVNGQLFAGLDQNKWFYGVVIALFDPTGSEGVWVAKYVNVMWSAVTISACIKLTTMFRGKVTGLLAGWLYAFLPLAYFLDRTSAVDPQTTALSTLALVFMLRWVRTLKLHDAGLLMLALLLARLTKPSMILYFSLPAVAYVLFRSLEPRFKTENRRDGLFRPLILVAQITAVPLMLTQGVYVYASMQGVRPDDTHQVALSNTVLGSVADLQLILLRFGEDMLTLGQRALELVSIVVLIGVLLAVLWLLLRSSSWRALLFLVLPALLFLAVPLLAERPAAGLRPRYLMLTGPPLVVLGALGIAELLQRVQVKARLPIAVTVLLGSVIQLASYRNNPVTVPNIGYVQQAAAEAIIADAGSSFNQQPVTVATTGNTWELRAYLGSRVNRIVWFEPDSRPELHTYAVEGQQLYVMEPMQSPPLQDFYSEAFQLETLLAINNPEGESKLYRVGGFRGAYAGRLYDARTVPPQNLVEFYDLVEQQAVEGPLYVFPRQQFDWYVEASQIDVEPLEINAWPLTDDVLQEVLKPVAQHQRVNVLLVDEASVDPSNQLVQTLQNGPFYQIRDAWFGPLHLMQYVTGPADVSPVPVGVTFEDAITLEGAVVIDEATTAGEEVRVRLNWRTNQPVADSFTMFAHVLDESGQLVAQRDRLPGNGTLPTNSWPVDESVSDQFALTLSPEIPSGQYRIVIGLYNANSGVRLRVTDGSDLPDAAEVGVIQINAK